MSSFACEEKPAAPGKGGLLVNGRSTWRTSKGICDLPPTVLPKQLLLAVGSRLSVRLSEDAPLAEWPGVKGLEGYDNGNYLAVLYFAWAYILSARCVELLSPSADHESQMDYDAPGISSAAPQPDERPAIQIDLGEEVSTEEALWWRTILSSDDCWGATTKYNGQVYFSPWSVSAKDVGLTVSSKLSVVSESSPPSSVVALGYLTRFCEHYRLYAQCSVALTEVLYIPFLWGKAISLPFPKQLSGAELTASFGHVSLTTINDLLETHKELLPKYMTLSSNPWGLRSLLCSTFFNPNIECNLVSAWLNPAFAVLNSISPTNPASIAALLSKRQPQLGILWLGAVCLNVVKPVLRDIHIGMVALDLPASAWTGVPQTFLTSQTQHVNGESIRRDDECRLLFITAAEGHDRPPIWPWKPFGATQLCDTELTVREHAQCAATHCLEYQSWEWLLSNDGAIQDFGKGDKRQIDDQTSSSTTKRESATPRHFNYDLLSQSLSEVATRGIFQWLRSTGYPPNERSIYQHSWIDIDGTDDEEPDDAESELGRECSAKEQKVESWLDGIDY
ncbi:uncharacterized protein ACLA_044570 [Aspergillus clavatus NRRL 1]|uniref:Uncharacterized protein n=1 Tax=Aspergillus clavatus (strain ATCC 1007 / CBS 513.65 / DSM 816 / NCTC 3887 / NRRL 1 / QM 1276 / 107) TaxID=344612 RepID=A1C8V0_ASPCL|nr:uncharacterized protein ACLA_044570 [Aspergillus clavatus NRRL 1]EAW13737.1 conserved hypothetical protein [Aspergillus clavatus NRRL 1]